MVTLSPSEFELLTPDERKSYFADEEKTVFGRTTTNDAAFERDRNGVPQERGIGSKGRESGNHFAGILKYEGPEAYEKALAEIWRRDPDHAKKLGLPQRRTAK